MTGAEWAVLSHQIAVAWSGQPLTDAEDRLYFDVMRGLTSDDVANGILRMVRDGQASRPSAGDLYKASAPASSGRLVVDISRTPMPQHVSPVPLPMAPRLVSPPLALTPGQVSAGRGATLGVPPGAPGMATAALVLGIVALFVPLCGVIALVLGGVALNKIQSIPGQPGRAQATAGLVLGIVFTAVWAWALIMLASSGV